jgi:hypothetical protein
MAQRDKVKVDAPITGVRFLSKDWQELRHL